MPESEAPPPKRRRRRWPWVAGVLILVTGAVTAILRADKPPMLLLETARKSISNLQAVEVSEWAPELLKAAQDSLRFASQEVDRENRRFFVIRDYDAARSQALAADRIARETIPIALARRDSVKQEAADNLVEAAESIKSAREMLEYLPMAKTSRSQVVQLELTRQQARRSLDEGLYRKSIDLTESVLSGAENIKASVSRQMDNYHDPIWVKWARDTIAGSRASGGYAILIRKFEHRCDVYHAGVLKTSFPVELGLRWMGQKMRAGDHVTPEGRYHVTNKKNGSRYYRALEINYPNAEDEVRFRLAKQSGAIPKRASIGGLIEIHGGGGKGKDWTQGCVALTNANIDKLFAMVGAGTPVTIVGSYDPDGTGALAAK
ncbi:MAG TPA: L,D-transpeptidase family protein [Candidatus Eisenbacteria bacterium]